LCAISRRGGTWGWWSLLGDVGQLVRQQPLPGYGPGTILPAPEEDLLPGGEGPRPQHAVELVGLWVCVQPHPLEVRAEHPLHRGTHLLRQRLADAAGALDGLPHPIIHPGTRQAMLAMHGWYRRHTPGRGVACCPPRRRTARHLPRHALGGVLIPVLDRARHQAGPGDRRRTRRLVQMLHHLLHMPVAIVALQLEQRPAHPRQLAATRPGQRPGLRPGVRRGTRHPVVINGRRSMPERTGTHHVAPLRGRSCDLGGSSGFEQASAHDRLLVARPDAPPRPGAGPATEARTSQWARHRPKQSSQRKRTLPTESTAAWPAPA